MREFYLLIQSPVFWLFFVLPLAALIWLFVLFLYSMASNIRAETFDLRKDEWVCTSSHDELRIDWQTLDGGATLTQTPWIMKVCDRYDRVTAKGGAQ